MGHYSTVEFCQERFENIKSKRDILSLLDEAEAQYIEDYYPDLAVEEGWLGLGEYHRKNYETDENWPSILRKIALFEGKSIAVVFSDCEGKWGYKSDENGNLFRLCVKETWIPSNGKRF